MELKVETLIARMEQARTNLNSALGKIAPQVEIYPSWKQKQVMDHIAGWDELVSETLRAYQRGETPSRNLKSIDHYNAGSISARKDLTLEQSRQAYENARREVILILRSLPAEMLQQKYKAPWGGNCTVASVVKIFVSHEQEHAKQIEEILNKSSTSS